MSKKRARIRFTWLAILVIIGLFLAICPWPIPGSWNDFNGFAYSIYLEKLGLDLKGGMSIVYTCTPADNSGNIDLATSIEATSTRLEQVLFNEGYSEARVTREGGDRIRIEIPGAEEDTKIFDALLSPQTLNITLDPADSTNPPEIRVTGTDIANVNVAMQRDNNSSSSTYGQDIYGVSVKFTNEGAEKFRKLTEDAVNGVNGATATKMIYMYLGEVNSNNLFSQVTCENVITDGSTFISGGSLDDYDSAREFALNLMSGSFQVKLTLFDSAHVEPILGRNALLYGIIAAAVALVIVMFIMWLRYGDFGLLANFALVVYVILMLFLLQAIPFVQLTLPGIAGIILSLGMAVDGNVIIFERIKEEYAKGKKVHIAVKSGFKRAFWPIFDSNITTIITSVILWILGTASIKGFAITLLLGILLSMFTSLVVTRFFVKSYLPLNTTNTKHLRLYREKGVVEIKEEEEKKPEEEAVPFDIYGPISPDDKNDQTGGENK